MTTESEVTHRKALLYEIFHLLSRRLPTADFNNDTVLDLAVANYHYDTSRVSVLRGRSERSLTVAARSEISA